MSFEQHRVVLPVGFEQDKVPVDFEQDRELRMGFEQLIECKLRMGFEQDMVTVLVGFEQYIVAASDGF